MLNKITNISLLITMMLSVMLLNGCTFIFQKGRRVDVEKISRLKSEMGDLEKAKSDLEQQKADLQREKNDLAKAKQELENRLRNEIKDEQVVVKMDKDNRLVITFIAEVLFKSGKASLLKSSLQKLEKVASVLNTTVLDLDVGIEGHTDNVPIKHSGWKSNWELSTARSLSVLHYLIDSHGIAPQRLSVTGYGEFQPIETNETKEGRQKNRRVEIIILPDKDKIEKKGL